MKTLHKNPITVMGKELDIGASAPDFTLIDNDLKKRVLSDFKKDYLLLSIIPSLDTGVCDFQTRNINEKLAAFNNVDFVTVSMDLPFAQKRWCGSAGLNVITLSDYQSGEFGLNYGVLIKELRLLARAVLVFDQKRKLVYKEYLEEMGNHPNYDKLMEFLTNL